MTRWRIALVAFALVAAGIGLACKQHRGTVAKGSRSRPPTTAQDPRTIRFLTYNVLADPVFREQRTPPLLRLLAESDADVIALQEVAPWFLSRLMAQDWVRAYHVTRFAGRVHAPGGQLILSRFPIRRSYFRQLTGRQRRTVVVAELRIGNEPVAVATTHMESYLEDGPIRARQLDEIFALLRDRPRAVVLGDLNFGDGEQPDSSRLDQSYVDVWLAANPVQPGHTWNIEQSEMARVGSFAGERSRRLDRILVRLQGYRPKSSTIIGDTPLDGDARRVFPSDHFGLIGVVARQAPSP